MTDRHDSGAERTTRMDIEALDPAMRERIEHTFSRDRAWALGLLILLWIAVAIVYLAVRPVVHSSGVSIALIVSAVLIVGYNTASVIAMIRHYAEDKRWIYEIDIRHLDQMRRKARH